MSKAFTQNTQDFSLSLLPLTRSSADVVHSNPCGFECTYPVPVHSRNTRKA